MKKVLAIILTALIIMGLFSAVTVSAAETAQVKAGDTTYYSNVGDSITYVVNLKSTSLVENGQFTINYPGNILEVASISFPIATNVSYNYTENLVDQIKFNFSHIAGYDFNSDNAVLVNVKFKVKSAGTGNITLDKEVMYNINDVDIISTSVFKEKITGASTTKPTEPTETEPQPTSPTVCTHKSTWTRGKKAATYFTKGYTGDKICNSCGKVVAKGKPIAKKTLATPKTTIKLQGNTIVISYKKVKNAQGFVINCKFGSQIYIKNIKTTKSKTIRLSNIKRGIKATVKVRAYTTSGKRKAYSNWTKTKTLKVK